MSRVKSGVASQIIYFLSRPRHGDLSPQIWAHFTVTHEHNMMQHVQTGIRQNEKERKLKKKKFFLEPCQHLFQGIAAMIVSPLFTVLQGRHVLNYPNQIQS